MMTIVSPGTVRSTQVEPAACLVIAVRSVDHDAARHGVTAGAVALRFTPMDHVLDPWAGREPAGCARSRKFHGAPAFTRDAARCFPRGASAPARTSPFRPSGRAVRVAWAQRSPRQCVRLSNVSDGESGRRTVASFCRISGGRPIEGRCSARQFTSVRRRLTTTGYPQSMTSSIRSSPALRGATLVGVAKPRSLEKRATDGGRSARGSGAVPPIPESLRDYFRSVPSGVFGGGGYGMPSCSRYVLNLAGLK